MENLISAIEAIEGARVARNVPLSQHTTWKVGGVAACMVWLDDRQALEKTCAVLIEGGAETLVLGNGSNVLVSDSGFAGAVLRLSGELATSRSDGSVMISGGGAALRSVVSEAARQGMSGLEFAVGIPGTTGGAVMTNAGAFSGTVANILTSVESMTASGEVMIRGQFEDVYRTPLVPREEIVIEARFALEHSSEADVLLRMEENSAARGGKQPRGATAGSVFKNPTGISAGTLIERCGLKGARTGGASISEVHANFIVNEGGAKASDIRSLMELAKKEVADRFGRLLEPEVVLIGFERE